MRTNIISRKPQPKTHEGATAYRINAEQELRRSVMSCLLWEDSFYESGVSIAERIKNLIPEVKPEKVAQIAIEARNQMKLRHIPLFIVREMARLPKHKAFVAATLEQVIQRADELAEFLAIYWKDADIQNGRILTPLSAQVKKGLAKAFLKFNEYNFAKYNRDGVVKLRDVLFLVHPKPIDDTQAILFSKIAENRLTVPDTWEVALSNSKGENKKEIWTRLLQEDKLGALALLRNLRNIKEAGVSDDLVITSLNKTNVSRVLPFRFISAARYAPQLEPQLEVKMFEALGTFEKLPGKTAIIIDNSGSMYGEKVSVKSEIDRSDAACALAVLIREICEQALVISFSNDAAIVPARRGFALIDAIKRATSVGGTYTEAAKVLADKEGYDRIIIVTDEQSHTTLSKPKKGQGYVVNVNCYQNGIGYGPWNHIDGFSESIMSYISATENFNRSST